MQIISVNVGLPRDVTYRGTTVRTGIFKEPVEGEVSVRTLNLDGDRQADLTVHGGADKAVYAYPAEHYAYWREQLPDTELSWGNFGENLTVTGLREDAVFIGDRLRLGSAVLEVTQPRMPCYKLAMRFRRDEMIKRFLASRRSGLYFRVLEEGEVSAGSSVEILTRDPNQISVADMITIYVDRAAPPELLNRALHVDALPESWKAWLRRRSAARVVESSR
ncbi:MAG TPA: MOSC domain-containing protein [Terriglobales bacterium]|jgi:MOSC domain-containing protein YiiM|nr:MOSC domain-containing protein [Terriglobales bacterium]